MRWTCTWRGTWWDVLKDGAVVGRLTDIENVRALGLRDVIEGVEKAATARGLLASCRGLFAARLAAGYITAAEEDALDAVTAFLRSDPVGPTPPLAESSDEGLPWLWVEGSENEQIATAKCGCRLIRDHALSGDPAFEMCAMHRAAEHLLVACEESLRHLRAVPDDTSEVSVPITFALDRLKTAVKAAKGERHANVDC